MLRKRKSVHIPSITKKRKIDTALLSTTIFLVIFGLVIVYDASVFQALKDYGDKYFYIRQQLIWVVLGFISLTFFAWFDYRNWRRISGVFFLISLVLLLAVFVPGLGLSGGGAHRWLKIGFFSLQPTEIIKLTSIIFLAAAFEKRIQTTLFLVVVSVVSFIIGVLQKDLGSTVVFSLTSLSIYIFSGAPIRYFLGFLPVGFIGFILFTLSSTYRKERVLAFLDPFADPRGYSYHIAQVLIALGTGGFTGLGIGQSRQKYSYIPEVTTDSIFAIVGEELGFLGSVLLIMAISFLIYRGFKIAENCDDKFGKFLAFGLTMWLGIQAIVNLGAMVSLIPLTGVPLPFISYGGSALLVNLVAVGILLNISKNSSES